MSTSAAEEAKVKLLASAHAIQKAMSTPASLELMQALDDARKVADRNIKDLAVAFSRMAHPGLAIKPELLAQAEEIRKSLAHVDKAVASLPAAKLPNWVLDESLLRSRIETPAIHTRSFVSRSPVLKTEPTKAELDQRRLSHAYDSLVKFEFEMRSFIPRRLAVVGGASWWKQRVPGDVITACQTRKIEKEKPSGPAHELISYAYPDDYRKIILRTNNWTDCFQAIFGNRNQVEACFTWIGAARPEIAHARPIADPAYANFVFAVRWVLTAAARVGA